MGRHFCQGARRAETCPQGGDRGRPRPGRGPAVAVAPASSGDRTSAGRSPETSSSAGYLPSRLGPVGPGRLPR